MTAQNILTNVVLALSFIYAKPRNKLAHTVRVPAEQPDELGAYGSRGCRSIGRCRKSHRDGPGDGEQRCSTDAAGRQVSTYASHPSTLAWPETGLDAQHMLARAMRHIEKYGVDETFGDVRALHVLGLAIVRVRESNKRKGFMRRMLSMLRKSDGQSIVEYALVVCAIALACIVAEQSVAVEIVNAVGTVSTSLAQAL